MQHVLIRARALLRRPLAAAPAFGLALVGTALVFVPLFNVPGYELSEALALLAGVLGGLVGIAAARLEAEVLRGETATSARGILPRGGPVRTAGAALTTAFTLTACALAVPFLVSLGWSLVGTRCNPFAHVGFFPLLTLPSAAIASAAGVFCGALMSGHKAWKAALAYVGLLLATLAVTGFPIYFGPQVFAFNHFLGYFPGPLYDEALTVRPALYWFRLQTFLWTALLFLITAYALDVKTGALRRPRLPSTGAWALVGALLLTALIIEQRGGVLGLRMSYAQLEEELGGVIEHEQFRIHYFRGKHREDLARLERDVAFRYDQLSRFLGERPDRPVRVYLYKDAAQKQALVGAGGTQFAKPWQLAVHINDAPFPHGVLKHELLHVMAAPFGTGPFATTARFGVVTQMAVIEGLAVAGDNRTDELTLHQWAAAMRKHGLAPEVPELFAAGGFYRHAASRAYTLTGSFLLYLGTQYGNERLRALYRYGDFEDVYGKPLQALADEYDAFLDTVPLDARAEAQAYQRFRRPSLFGRACAREVASLEQAAAEFFFSDPAESARLYERCGALQPEEPSHALGQARALARAGELDAAEALLEALSKKLAERPATEAEVSMSRGDLAWQRSRLDLARGHYDRVLALEPGPQLDRTARVKLSALGTAWKAPAIQAYFGEGPEDVRLYVLREALGRLGDDAELEYLLGRRLSQAGAPGLSRGHLDRSLALGLPETIHREALRLRVEAAYLAGDCASVREQVRKISAGDVGDQGAAFELAAVEWAERCDFEDRAYNGPLVPAGPFR